MARTFRSETGQGFASVRIKEGRVKKLEIKLLNLFFNLPLPVMNQLYSFFI